MKLHLVTSGEYSDYRLKGVYDSPEKAEAARAIFATTNEVEEFELNEIPPAPPGMLGFQCYMGKDGNTKSVDRCSGEDVTDKVYFYDMYWRLPQHGPICGLFRMWARDEQHALKIANERRTQRIALNQFPDTREELDAMIKDHRLPDYVR
jgi:hypothetical protein